MIKCVIKSDVIELINQKAAIVKRIHGKYKMTTNKRKVARVCLNCFVFSNTVVILMGRETLNSILTAEVTQDKYLNFIAIACNSSTMQIPFLGGYTHWWEADHLLWLMMKRRICIKASNGRGASAFPKIEIESCRLAKFFCWQNTKIWRRELICCFSINSHLTHWLKWSNFLI